MRLSGMLGFKIGRPLCRTLFQGVSPVLEQRQQVFRPNCWGVGLYLGNSYTRQFRVFAAAAQVALESPTAAEELVPRPDIRNIAIIAHVDHGKTTLVDAMLKQSKIFKADEKLERIMDSNELEKERGITILSKNTAIRYRDTKINIIDTPGHADFGGEVERVLNMCDGVLLLVDSVEGPMPQTRFVLRNALELDKKVIVVVNKVDRDSARPDWVIDQTFDLFVDLGASDEQCDFPVVYASGINGIAGLEKDQLEKDLEPLFQSIIREISPPMVNPNAALQMLVTNLDYDDHKGRIGIGRVRKGTLKRGSQVAVMNGSDGPKRSGKIAELFVYDNFSRVDAQEVSAGDICAFSGVGDLKIGDTVTCPKNPSGLPSITVEEPTVSMVFGVNTSPMAGQEGKFLTSRNIKERLQKELEMNVALRVEEGQTSDQFVVKGRGMLHLGILIENMRREGFEFSVGPPKVISKEVEGKKLEPYEEAIIEVPEEHVGTILALLGSRKAELIEVGAAGQGNMQRAKYRIPTRGLIGMRSTILTQTRGTAILNTVFSEYGEHVGELSQREMGSLTSYETGKATAYALENLQSRGQFFIKPGEEVYENQVVGSHIRNNDLKVNVCKGKNLTNIRASRKEEKTNMHQMKVMDLDSALEYIAEDELVEVTPKSIRMRKNPAMLRITKKDIYMKKGGK